VNPALLFEFRARFTFPNGSPSASIWNDLALAPVQRARLCSPSAGTREFAECEGRGQWQPHPTGQRGGCHRPRCRIFGLSVAFQLTGHREFHPRPRRGALLSRFAKPRPSCSPALTSGRLHGATLGERSGTIIRPAAEGGDWADVGERCRVPSPRIFAGERASVRGGDLRRHRPPRHAAGCDFTVTPYEALSSSRSISSSSR